MLVLSRQRDESIIIDDVIEITIVDIRGEKVRLGINAPPHISVHRKEVYEAIKKEKEAAAQKTGGQPAKVESLAKRKPAEEQAPKPPEATAEPPAPPPPEAPAKPEPSEEPPPPEAPAEPEPSKEPKGPEEAPPAPSEP